MDDRNNRYGRSGSNYGPDYGSGRDHPYPGARDDSVARSNQGRRDYRDDDRWNERSGYGGQTRDWGDDDTRHAGGNQGGGYGSGFGGGFGEERGHRRAGYGAGARSDHGAQHDPGEGFHGHPRDYDRERGQGGLRGRERGDNSQDRGFFERAGDEVRSWFGDDEAERRREQDQRYDAQQGRNERWAERGQGDNHYHQWRRQRIDELDRDYDEYRRENAQRFHNEFSNWRTERQGQRDSLSRVEEHMEVVGSDGLHVGTVDKVRGDRILLTKSDTAAGGHHHSIPSRWIQVVEDKVTLRKTADEAKAHWKDEERGDSTFGDGREDGGDRQNWRTSGNLNRSFSGTY